jgi:hypothetical protein
LIIREAVLRGASGEIAMRRNSSHVSCGRFLAAGLLQIATATITPPGVTAAKHGNG